MKPETVDEFFIARVVDGLKKCGFPSTDGYYPVFLTPNESIEFLRSDLGGGLKARRRPPTLLIMKLVREGFEVLGVVDDALVVAFAQPVQPARPHLRLIKGSK